MVLTFIPDTDIMKHPMVTVVTSSSSQTSKV